MNDKDEVVCARVRVRANIDIITAVIAVTLCRPISYFGCLNVYNGFFFHVLI